MGMDYGESPSYKQWDVLTSTIIGYSTTPFLLLQLPQILLNAQNILSGNRSTLLVVGWLAWNTSYFGGP